MKRILIIALLACFAFCACKNEVSTPQADRYKLYETTNLWNFLKLDTQTGRIWIVQYTINEDANRVVYPLSEKSLVSDSNNLVNGRFELCPTKNMYNFILLDKINGKTWQVQWSFEEENRFVIPIQ